MRKVVSALAVFVTLVAGSGALIPDLPELKVDKVELVPNSEQDWKQDTFFQNHPIIELAPGLNVGGESFRLTPSRSYRLIVTIRNVGKGVSSASFLVKTECVRAGKSVTLGKARVNSVGGQVVYACYDVYPAEGLRGDGGSGDCMVRTVVDAENDVKEADEHNNILEFKATITK